MNDVGCESCGVNDVGCESCGVNDVGCESCGVNDVGCVCRMLCLSLSLSLWVLLL